MLITTLSLDNNPRTPNTLVNLAVQQRESNNNPNQATAQEISFSAEEENRTDSDHRR